MNISLSLVMYVLGRIKCFSSVYLYILSYAYLYILSFHANSNVYSATKTMLNIFCCKEKQASKAKTKKEKHVSRGPDSCLLTRLTLWAPRQNTLRY